MSSSSDAVALLELRGVAAGYTCLDIVIKHSPVDILEANLIEPGKFLILYTGGVAEVRSTSSSARRKGRADYF